MGNQMETKIQSKMEAGFIDVLCFGFRLNFLDTSRE